MSVPENDNQPVQQPSNSENPTKPVGMLTYFWWTILTLISITVVLLILATLNQDPRQEEEQRVRIEQGKESPQPEEDLRVRVEQRKGPILESVLHPKSFKKTDKTIDEQIDLAFKPVYERISEFLDRHYSIPGQYEQLATAARGKLKSQLEERLFSGVKKRLENASAKIDETLKTEFRSLLSQKIHDEVQTVDDASKIIYKHAWDEAMQGSILHLASSVGASGAATVLAGTGGVAFVGVITKVISKKLLTSVAAKTTVKAATKMGWTMGAVATGAAIGAFLGPVGSAIGGVSGAVIVWLGVDAAVVAVDEHFNKDAFKQELITLVDEQKDEIKSLMREAKSKTLKEVLKTLDNVPPSQM